MMTSTPNFKLICFGITYLFVFVKTMLMPLNSKAYNTYTIMKTIVDKLSSQLKLLNITATCDYWPCHFAILLNKKQP